MKRYAPLIRRDVEHPKIDAFLQELDAVCAKHGFDLETGYDQEFLIVSRTEGPWEESALGKAEDLVTESESAEGVTVFSAPVYTSPPEVTRAQRPENAVSLFSRRPNRHGGLS